MSVVFNVDNVEVLSDKLEMSLLSEVPSVLQNHRDFWDKKSATKTKNVMLASSVNEPICHGTMYNSLIECWTKAYDKHIPLKITSAQIKLHLLKQFGVHILVNSETYQSKFIDGGKVTLKQEVLSNPDWVSVINKFTEGIKDNVKDTTLTDFINKIYESSTPASIVASKIAMMDIFKTFFEYKMYTLCGIPEIKLVGSTDEWLEIKSFVQYMNNYDLQWWTEKLLPIIDEFINASQNKFNVEFWQNIVKKSGGSGGPYFTGWIKYLFPYFETGRGGHIPNSFGDKMSLSSVPSGFSHVDVEWTYLGNMRNCEFYGGFVGYKYDGKYLEPNIGWFVTEKIKELNSKLENVLELGTWLEPANNKYGEGKWVVCDFCDNHHLDKCVSYENHDICVTCVKAAYDLGSVHARKFRDHF